MKCLLDQKLVDCKVVDYKGREVVVVKAGGRWIKHRPEILPRGPIMGQQR